MSNRCRFTKEFQYGTSGQNFFKMKADHSGEIILELSMRKTLYGFQQMLTKLKEVFAQYKIEALKEAAYVAQQEHLPEVKKRNTLG